MGKKIIGLDKEINLLKKLYQKGKLANFYLFLGAEGIGKKEAALYLAKILNCQKHTPCQKCQDCLLIDNNCHPDVHIIEPEKSITIAQIRDIKRKAYIKTISYRKVFIVDDVHKLTLDAGNAFLKILEEPPQNTIFILITHKLHLLLKTLQSRAVKIWFSPDSEKIREYIKETNPAISKEEIEYLLNITGNSLGRIKAWFDNNLGSIKDETAKTLLSKKSFCNLEAYLKKNRNLFKEEISFLMLLLRDILVLKNGGNSMLINKNYYEIINSCRQRYSEQELIGKFSKLVEIYEATENINLHLAEKLLDEVFYG